MPTKLQDTDQHNANATTSQERLLLHRMASGEAEAFWSLWEPYRHTVLARCCLRWMGGSPEDAEDALSSASLKAYQSLPSCAHEIVNVKAWLIRLLFTHCMNLHRGKRSHLRRVRIAADPAVAANGSRLTDHRTRVQESTEDMMLRRELRVHLRRNVYALPPRLRDPLILYFFHGMSQRAIATYLNLSPANVRKRLQQARDRLRERMTAYFQN